MRSSRTSRGTTRDCLACSGCERRSGRTRSAGRALRRVSDLDQPRASQGFHNRTIRRGSLCRTDRACVVSAGRGSHRGRLDAVHSPSLGATAPRCGPPLPRRRRSHVSVPTCGCPDWRRMAPGKGPSRRVAVRAVVGELESSRLDGLARVASDWLGGWAGSPTPSGLDVTLGQAPRRDERCCERTRTGTPSASEASRRIRSSDCASCWSARQTSWKTVTNSSFSSRVMTSRRTPTA